MMVMVVHTEQDWGTLLSPTWHQQDKYRKPVFILLVWTMLAQQKEFNLTADLVIHSYLATKKA